MAVLEKKQLTDQQSHNFLIENGFINVKNTFSLPCYKDKTGRLIQFPYDKIIHTYDDLFEVYYQMGIITGRSFQNSRDR